MTGGTHSQSSLGKILFEPGSAPHTFDANSLAIEFLAEDVKRHGRHGGNNGNRGTLARDISRRRDLASYYYGPIHLYLTPNNADWIFANLLGYTESPADTFVTNDNPPYFGILMDRDYDTFEYKDCKIDSWVLRSRAPEFNERGEPDLFILTLNIIASDEAEGTAWPNPAPSIGTTAVEDSPLGLADTDGAFTLMGSARAVQEVTLAVRNNLRAKYANSLKPHSIQSRGRFVQMEVVVPWNSTNDDLYTQGVNQAAASFVATNSGCSVTMTLGKWSVPAESPTMREKDEIKLYLRGEGLADGATPDLTIVVDHTE